MQTDVMFSTLALAYILVMAMAAWTRGVLGAITEAVENQLERMSREEAGKSVPDMIDDAVNGNEDEK
ncbi:MAG: hypothetical protein AAF585_27755, partial [Verrucomicrobiota bacterium]